MVCCIFILWYTHLKLALLLHEIVIINFLMSSTLLEIFSLLFISITLTVNSLFCRRCSYNKQNDVPGYCVQKQISIIFIKKAYLTKNGPIQAYIQTIMEKHTIVSKYGMFINLLRHYFITIFSYLCLHQSCYCCIY